MWDTSTNEDANYVYIYGADVYVVHGNVTFDVGIYNELLFLKKNLPSENGAVDMLLYVCFVASRWMKPHGPVSHENGHWSLHFA